MLKKRASLPILLKQEYDNWVCETLYDLISEKKYTKIHCYLPIRTEINIYPLIEKLLSKSITVITPKTLKNSNLKHLILTSLNNIEEGILKTKHPAGNKEYKGNYDLIIVPGLAFDYKNYRLGYGGGYYDAFLANHPKAEKVGLFYPFQEVSILPTEAHDLKLDTILVNKDFVLNK